MQPKYVAGPNVAKGAECDPDVLKLRAAGGRTPGHCCVTTCASTAAAAEDATAAGSISCANSPSKARQDWQSKEHSQLYGGMWVSYRHGMAGRSVAAVRVLGAGANLLDNREHMMHCNCNSCGDYQHRWCLQCSSSVLQCPAKPHHLVD